jgi:excisionase family DNA binding protein
LRKRRRLLMLTVNEVADILRVEHKTVRSLIKSGKLKAIRLGRVLRIREMHLEEFLEKQQVKS